MTVAFDIGNTNIRVGRIVDGLLNVRVIPNRFGKTPADVDLQNQQFVEKELVSWLNDAQPVSWLGVSVHRHAETQLREIVTRRFPGTLIDVLRREQIPIQLDLNSPETVGTDRLLTAWYASSLQLGPSIAVDAGSAVTIDWVDQQQVFRGGMIFPGMRLAAKILHDATDALPEVPVDDPWATQECVYGRDTRTAIQTGLLWSQWGGICQGVKRLQMLVENQAKVTLTGGGILPYLNLLPTDWHFDPELNLKALLELAKRLEADG